MVSTEKFSVILIIYVVRDSLSEMFIVPFTIDSDNVDYAFHHQLRQLTLKVSLGVFELVDYLIIRV